LRRASARWSAGSALTSASAAAPNLIVANRRHARSHSASSSTGLATAARVASQSAQSNTVSSSRDSTSIVAPPIRWVDLDVHAVHCHGAPVSVPVPVNAPPVSVIVNAAPSTANTTWNALAEPASPRTRSSTIWWCAGSTVRRATVWTRWPAPLDTPW